MKKILCLDAGGIKGIASCMFLYYLDIFLKENNSSILEYFDLFVGTSVGSLIISALVYEKMDIKDILNILCARENIDTIFNGTKEQRELRIIEQLPKYDGLGKTMIIKKYINTNKTIQDTPDGKDVMILALKLATRKINPISSDDVISRHNSLGNDGPIISVVKEPMFFKSWETPTYNVVEVCDASSAAPIFFPTKNVYTTKSETETYDGCQSFQTLYKEEYQCIDGGVITGDPTLYAYLEAIKRYGVSEDIRILSVGTGLYKNNSLVHENAGFDDWISSGDLIGLLMSMQKESCVNLLQDLTKVNNHKYLRVNGYLLDISLDNTSKYNIESLKKNGELWWSIYESEFRNIIYESKSTSTLESALNIIRNFISGNIVSRNFISGNIVSRNISKKNY